MLLRLLKAAFARRARPAAPSSADGPAHSNLALLSRLASLASGRALEVTGKEAPVDAAGAARAELPIETIVAHAAGLRC
ncbi:MAG: hypothetical protein R3357_16110, partial [Burkholderiales bacterium]|nr:hypothetical protein [Burkholderiales bacterium]